MSMGLKETKICDCKGTAKIIYDDKSCCPLYYQPRDHRRLLKLTDGHLQVAYSDSGGINWMHFCEAGKCGEYLDVPAGHIAYIEKPV